MQHKHKGHVQIKHSFEDYSGLQHWFGTHRLVTKDLMWVTISKLCPQNFYFRVPNQENNVMYVKSPGK